jgi:hypothetical protein
MVRPLWIGEIAEKDGMICLQTGAHVWYPLGGSSGIAEKFRESFGQAQPSDIGKRLYNFRGVLQMENAEQVQARSASENVS